MAIPFYENEMLIKCVLVKWHIPRSWLLTDSLYVNKVDH